MASELDRAGVADALAGALVLADLSKPKQAAGFSVEVSRVAQWAAEAGDEIAIALVHEIQELLTGIKLGTMPPEEAADLIGQMITAMLEAPVAQPAAAAPLADSEPAPTPAPAPETLPAQGNVYAHDEAVLKDFVAGAREQLDEADAMLSAGATGKQVDVDSLFRCFHTLKGIAGFLSLEEMAEAAHSVETALEPVRSGKEPMSEALIDEALKTVDRIRAMVEVVDSGRKSVARERRSTNGRTAENVRVDSARLDDLLDAIGELVVAESELATIVLALRDERAKRSLERLARIARDMQASATSLRMISLGPTFRKMTRVVRDMLAKSGKRVEFEVSGADTELDRAIVDGISDPLVHLLRNAIDHGIEMPAERKALGKPDTARVELRAFHRSGSVHIEVADDGRGIDAAKLVARANELGIEFDREDPLSLIFLPGLSTAKEVTEISGRGVGMDAVSTAVGSLRGQLDVQSVEGEGTVISIRLPLTLAVIDGIVLRAGGERYIVPTEFVERTVSVADGEIVSAAGRGEVLVLADGPLAVYPITAPMGGTLESGHAAVIVHDSDTRFALLVDEVIGQQSLVIKALSGPVTKAAGVAGAALMGDGRAALVVDPFGMSKAIRGGWRGDAPRGAPVNGDSVSPEKPAAEDLGAQEGKEDA